MKLSGAVDTGELKLSGAVDTGELIKTRSLKKIEKERTRGSCISKRGKLGTTMNINDTKKKKNPFF
jgi:hypothetical protein